MNGVVPVSPEEPLPVIEGSVECMRSLETPEDVDFSCIYVIDTEDAEEDDNVEFLQRVEDDRVEVVVREPGEGRRAAAINRGLEEMEDPDHVAVFDVDTRVEEDFLEEAMRGFEEDVVFVTGPRRILNPDTNTVTKAVDTEFQFFSDMQRMLGKLRGFNHANGLIGMLDADYLMEERLETGLLCSDTEFSERAYSDGKRMKMIPQMEIGEQAVTTSRDLYSQKLRWMTGAVEGLQRYTVQMARDAHPRVALTWFLTMVLPFFAAVFSPLTFGYAAVRYGKNPGEAVHRGLGFFILAWVISFAGAEALAKNLSGRRVKWKVPEREKM